MKSATDSHIPYYHKKTPQTYFGENVTGRFREVSVNSPTNRAYFVNDVLSRIYVCDLTRGDILFTVSKRISYPLDAYAKGQMLIVSNYNSSSVTFYTLDGDLISEYRMGNSILGIAMDSRGGLNVCTSDSHCIVEIDGMEVTERGGGWLNFPSNLASHGEFLYILDSGEECCRVMRDGLPLKTLLRYSSRLISIPYGISVDTEGNVIISDSGKESILVFAPDGKLLNEIKYGCELKSVGGIDLDQRGGIVVTCPLDGNLAFVI